MKPRCRDEVSLALEMEFDLFQPEACPADHVFNIPQMKGSRREEALARFEVAATQKKAKLIGGRTQVRGGLLDCLGEIKILLALETIKHRGRLEGFLLDGVKNIHSRHGGLLARSCRNRNGANERDSSTKGFTKSLGMLAQTFGKPAGKHGAPRCQNALG